MSDESAEFSGFAELLTGTVFLAVTVYALYAGLTQVALGGLLGLGVCMVWRSWIRLQEHRLQVVGANE